MRERPILFSGPMVRAILDGRKTQTRRVVKPQFPPDVDEVSERPALDPVLKCVVSGHSGEWEDCHGLDEVRRCPYGQPGDRMWVKETYSAHGAFGDLGRKFYRADIADGKEPNGMHWRPSIFMSRSASRITLEVVSVRVECLNDISEADAKAEGVIDRGNYWLPSEELNEPCSFAYGAYRTLWESINGPGSWAANPWVWVVTFKRVSP